MFLVLSRLPDLFLAPLTWALLFLATAALLRRRAVISSSLFVAGVCVLYAFSIAPVTHALSRTAERDVPKTWRQDVVYDAVIVLGGGLDASATTASGGVEFNAAPERILRGFELVRTARASNVLISGGAVEPGPDQAVEAEVLAGLLASWGVPREQIFVGGRSRNTHENAVYSAELVREPLLMRVSTRAG